MVRKYSVECPFPNCGKWFTNVIRHQAIKSMKKHARTHGVDYMIDDVEYRIKEFEE
jgi:hypothetical protein